MKKTLFLLGSVFSSMVLGQNTNVGIGTPHPDSSAILDLSTSNKGFLPPRIGLNSTTDVITIPNPATGLLVFNSGTGTLATKGYYYWDGAKWARLSIADGSGSLQVGEERGYRFVVPGTFQNSSGNTNKNQMTGRAATQTGTIQRKALSEFVNISDLPLFEGLRLDVLGGENNILRPRFYNTTMSNIVVSYTTLSTSNPLQNSPNMTIIPNYYSTPIDGDDWLNTSDTNMEQDLVEILFPDGKYYRMSIVAYSTNSAYDTTASNTVIGISLKRVQ
ncbi:hypothetical protein ACM40_13625 [Chryseobacterium sp. BLS98]|uniref:hypothetical protein n=1 Tax=Chryseobacterium sp. BLS98 TaxID=885586 RepID=UPI00065AFFAB|nr:hypothetical protein [Chryseobacterium sp. BLS98]KMQ60774.1 hypothetical protein ACM40_13625 [Chryseobacterium sp. BLS98]